MIDLWIEHELCTGCGVCANICPRNAIEMRKDSKGFLYPHINDKCIECGKCQTVCNKRYEKKNNSTKPTVYAAWSKNAKTRFLSTSGGLFSELAMSVIDMGGAVSGAQYTENCLVELEIVSERSGIDQLRQSKYVQSDSGNIYRRIRNILKSGKQVLFCGTPCQTAAVEAFLDQGDKANLFTVDFICMGVNSPKAYQAWLLELEEEQGKDVNKVWFKYKKNGWKRSPLETRIQFSDGTWREINNKENLYMQGFLMHKAFIRPCCGKCQFKGFPRPADITLGDFWGIEKSLDDDKGVSMVMINSKKGERLFRLTAPKIIYDKRTVEEVTSGNVHLYQSVAISEKEDVFFTNLEDMKFSSALKSLQGH